MQVILTPTSIANMFGPGLNGFNDNPLLPPTQLSPQWFNSVQQEIVNVCTAGGAALDALQFDQMKQAIDVWTFTDPTITGTVTIEGTGALLMETGSTLTAELGTTCVFQGNVVLDVSATFAANCVCDFNDDVNFHGDVTIGDDGTDTLTVKATSSFEGGATFESTADFNGAASVLGVNGGSLSGDTAAICTWNGQMIIGGTGRLRVNAGISAAAGDISRLGVHLQYHDGTTSRWVAYSPFGSFKLHGKSDAPATAATVDVDTTASGAPRVACDVDVFSTFMVQRTAGPGDIIVSLHVVGVGQIGTSFTVNCPYSAGTQYFPITMERVHPADTTARFYRLTIDGNGSNVAVRNARIIAEPATK
jgi:hypothetical protein